MLNVSINGLGVMKITPTVMTIGKLERKNEYALSQIKLIHTSLFRISARLPSKSDIIVCGLNDIFICAALLRNSLNKNLYVGFF